jgi:signal peptidase I
MQPTLWGIENANLIDQPEIEIPGRYNVGRFFDYWFNGVGYTHVTAKADGRLEIVDDKPSRFLLFNLKQQFRIGNETHTIWFPPDNLWENAGLKSFGVPITRQYKKGEDVIRLRTVSGDHLFVDRFTYNFRQPKRGEIIVFETRGINGLPQDQYYIKRLVALGGDEVRLLDDHHLEINGERLDASTSHFELVYSFEPGPPRPNHYSGHVNGTVARNIDPRLAPLFPNEETVYKVPKNHYLVMGDNTLRSFDSRAWGAFTKENVIGQSFFIYWPIGQQPGQMGRFGWSHR